MIEPVQLEFSLWSEARVSYFDMMTDGKGRKTFNELMYLAWQRRDGSVFMYDSPASMHTIVRYRV